MNKALVLGFFAGFIGGCLGMGGATILVPAWLDMGIDRSMASSSSAPLIFSSALIAFIIAAMADYYDSLVEVLLYFVLGFVASFYVKRK